MKNFIANIFRAFIVTILLVSCDVLNQEPINEISIDSYFQTERDAETAIIGGYNRIVGGRLYGMNYILFGDLPTDDAVSSGQVNFLDQIVNRQIDVDNQDVNNVWGDSYRAIVNLNLAIERIPEMPNSVFTGNRKNELLAEALTMRAMVYFNLVRLWGDVPFITTVPTSNTVADNAVARTPTEDIYSVLLDDVSFAINELPVAYANIASTKGRITQSAARMLLGDMLMTLGRYTEAEDVYRVIVNSTNYALAETYEEVFLNENSSEAILELQFNEVQNNGGISTFPYTQVNVAVPPNYRPSQSLIDLYDANDSRLPVNFILTDVSNPLVNKYEQVINTDNIIVYRLPETMLNLAECILINDGVSQEIIDLVNEIRERAGVGQVSLQDYNSVDLLQTLIDEEKRRELAFEGKRWFDLVRRGDALDVLNLNSVDQLLLPIPGGEIRRNPLLVQNPGYN